MAPFFDQVQAALAGARLPLDAGSTKVLNFILRPSEGCDITITPDTFFIKYGWHLAHHRYKHDIAPRIVSWLCEAAPTGHLVAGALSWWFEVTDERGRLESHWTYGPRRIWFDASPERVVIKVRDATVDPGAESIPPPIEPPIEYLVGAHPCPHCRVVPERYRKLRDGWLVCLACGRSSAPGRDVLDDPPSN